MPLDLNAAMSLFLPLRGTTQATLKELIKGTGSLTYTRATTATRLDPATNQIAAVASGELREDGRGYYNRLLYSEDFSQAAWTKTNVAVSNDNVLGPNGKTGVAQTLTASAANGTCLQAVTDTSRARYGSIYLKRKTGSGNIQVTLDGGATWTTVTVTGDWTRLGAGQTLANPSFGIRIVTSGDAVYVFGGHLNDGSAATRYVKSGSSPAYFPKGVLIEGQRTNLLLYSRDLTNAAWAKTSCTAAKDQTGEDGAANSASSLLATADAATCLQALTVASAAFSGSISIKRITGTGAVSITLDGGATWVDVTASLSTTVWYRALKENQTLANPSFGIKLATSGDKVAVDYTGVEQATFCSSRIPTTSAAVTRNMDDLSLPSSGNIDVSLGSAFCQIAPVSNTSQFNGFQTEGYLILYRASDATTGGINTAVGYAIASGANGTDLSKLCTAWAASGVMRAVLNGGAVASGGNTGNLGTGALSVGVGLGYVKTLVISNRSPSDAEMQAITAAA